MVRRWMLIWGSSRPDVLPPSGHLPGGGPYPKARNMPHLSRSVLLIVPLMAFMVFIYMVPLLGVAAWSVTLPEPGFGQYQVALTDPLVQSVFLRTFRVCLIVLNYGNVQTIWLNTQLNQLLKKHGRGFSQLFTFLHCHGPASNPFQRRFNLCFASLGFGSF